LINRNQPGESLNAWKQAIKLLADYRQLPPVGRRGTPGAPRTFTRSNWPEADSLRAITGLGASDHLDVLTTTEAFPRAELGLPYVIKFRSRAGEQGDGANDCTVYPLEANRAASPVILKPLAFGADGKRAAPMLMLMSRYGANGVRIDFLSGRKEERRGSQFVTDPRFARYRNSPMAGRSPNGSAVEGLLAFADEKGFRY
jgi:hypothetical protein